MKEKQLAYISGFLDCLISLNSFANDGKSYSVYFLQKKSAAIADIIREHLGDPRWIINAEHIQENWKDVFKKELVPYFACFTGEICRYAVMASNQFNKFHLDLEQEIKIRKFGYGKYQENIDDTINKFNELIGQLLSKDFIFYKIEVDSSAGAWYETYANDYAFDLGDEILFIHFGASD